MVGSMKDYDYDVIIGGASGEYPSKFCIDFTNDKDQGSIQACLACAIATVMEQHFGIEFSESDCYSRCRGEKSTQPAMTPGIALNKVVEIGVVPKSKLDLPLLEMPEMKSERAKFPECDKYGLEYRPKAYIRITGSGKQKDLNIKKELMSRNLLIGISPKYFGETHAVVIKGWNDDEEKYIVLNSQNRTWCENAGAESVPKDEISAVYEFIWEDIKLPFEDVSENDWFANSVNKMYLAGYIKGRREKEFAPNDYITRAEVCELIYRVVTRDDEEHQTLAKMIDVKAKYKRLGDI